MLARHACLRHSSSHSVLSSTTLLINLDKFQALGRRSRVQPGRFGNQRTTALFRWVGLPFSCVQHSANTRAIFKKITMTTTTTEHCTVLAELHAEAVL